MSARLARGVQYFRTVFCAAGHVIFEPASFSTILRRKLTQMCRQIGVLDEMSSFHRLRVVRGLLAWISL
jgi:hypothetical protein